MGRKALFEKKALLPIRLNLRPASLPLAWLVSPASSTLPFSATGGGGVEDPIL